MLSEAASEVDNVIYYVLSEGAKGALDPLIQLLLLGEGLRHGLQIDGQEHVCTPRGACHGRRLTCLPWCRCSTTFCRSG